jgi:hypothetical protein
MKRIKFLFALTVFLTSVLALSKEQEENTRELYNINGTFRVIKTYHPGGYPQETAKAELSAKCRENRQFIEFSACNDAGDGSAHYICHTVCSDPTNP